SPRTRSAPAHLPVRWGRLAVTTDQRSLSTAAFLCLSQGTGSVPVRLGCARSDGGPRPTPAPQTRLRGRAAPGSADLPSPVIAVIERGLQVAVCRLPTRYGTGHLSGRLRLVAGPPRRPSHQPPQGRKAAR